MSPPPIWGLFLLAAHNAGYGRPLFAHAQPRCVTCRVRLQALLIRDWELREFREGSHQTPTGRQAKGEGENEAT